MVIIQIELPEEIARRAEREGLLSSGAIEALLAAALRRRAGQDLMQVARDIQSADIPPMSMEEIDAEVKAVRNARRGRKA